MKSNAKTVDEYIDDLDGERKEAIRKLREIIRGVFPDSAELMKYKMPTYKFQDKIYAFASQKHYISLYIYDTDLLIRYKDQLKNADICKHCIRFKRLKDMDFGVIKNIFEDSK